MQTVSATFCLYDSPNNVGGPSSWILRLLPAIRQCGIEPNCLVLCWGRSGPVLEGLRHQGITCADIVCKDDSPARITWVLHRLMEARPDVFVPNLVVPALFAGRWARAAGIPTVGVLHSDDGFYRAVQDEFVFGDSRYALSSLVVVSRLLEEQARSRNARHTSVQRIPYGVPVPERRVRRAASQLRVAYVGRLAEEQKRISEVTRAFCRMVKEIPDSNATVFGDGPDRANVERILAAEGQGLPLELAGRVASDQIQNRLLDLDVIVLLSDYEGLPIAILEAMACGVVPVCLRMRSGIPELVDDGVTGLVVENRGDGFIEAIRRLKNDPALWQRLSDAARRRIEEENSIDACTEKWTQLLRKLANQSQDSKPIRIPRRFKLPPVHPALAPEDPRTQTPGVASAVYRKSRTLAGRVKRSLAPSRKNVNGTTK